MRRSLALCCLAFALSGPLLTGCAPDFESFRDDRHVEREAKRPQLNQTTMKGPLWTPVASTTAQRGATRSKPAKLRSKASQGSEVLFRQAG